MLMYIFIWFCFRFQPPSCIKRPNNTCIEDSCSGDENITTKKKSNAITIFIISYAFFPNQVEKVYSSSEESDEEVKSKNDRKESDEEVKLKDEEVEAKDKEDEEIQPMYDSKDKINEDEVKSKHDGEEVCLKDSTSVSKN